jgi:hypothetical protein
MSGAPRLTRTQKRRAQRRRAKQRARDKDRADSPTSSDLDLLERIQSSFDRGYTTYLAPQSIAMLRRLGYSVRTNEDGDHIGIY